MGKKIALISALGGQGTTLAAAGMGLAASALGRRMTLVDLCGFGGTLARVLGVGEEVVMNLGDVLRGECAADEALVPCGEGLRLLPSPVFSETAVNPVSVEARRVVETLARESDLIADWPSGAVPDCGAAGCFDVFVICACADRMSLLYAAALRRQIRRAAEENCRGCGIRLLLTRFSPESMRSGGVADIDECIDTVGARLLGAVPFDEETGRSIRRGESLRAQGEAVRGCYDALRRLYGETVPLDTRSPLMTKWTP